MATLVKSEKLKLTAKRVNTYATAEEASLAKNEDLLRRISKLNVKVVVKK